MSRHRATEFGWSQSYAYRVLDQGRVTLALQEASGSTMVEVTEREAREVKPVLPDVVDEVASRVEAEPDRPPADVVRDAVAEFRRAPDPGPTQVAPHVHAAPATRDGRFTLLRCSVLGHVALLRVVVPGHSPARRNTRRTR